MEIEKCLNSDTKIYRLNGEQMVSLSRKIIEAFREKTFITVENTCSLEGETLTIPHQTKVLKGDFGGGHSRRELLNLMVTNAGIKIKVNTQLKHHKPMRDNLQNLLPFPK